MNRKILWIVLIVLILLGSFAAAFADQDGRRCWCNIDEYGCWITNEDGGKTYIMFWSEEARLSIMGTGSAPYKYVVAKPGSSDFLTIDCGTPQPLIIATDPVVTPTKKPTPETTPTPVPTEETQEPTQDPCAPYNECLWKFSCDGDSDMCGDSWDAWMNHCAITFPGCVN